MAKFRLKSLVATLVLGTGIATAVGQAADGTLTPMEIIRSSNEAILALFGDDDALNADEEARVFEIMNDVTDFATMSEAAVGDLCTVEADKCEEWKDVFRDLLRIRSIKELGRYRADHFDYLSEEIDGNTAVVNTLAYFEDEEFTLDYELELMPSGAWRVVNYIVDDIDTVRSYRRSFTRLLEEGTVDDVIARLRARLAEYEVSS